MKHILAAHGEINAKESLWRGAEFAKNGCHYFSVNMSGGIIIATYRINKGQNRFSSY
jgi:hypothetical protein